MSTKPPVSVTSRRQVESGRWVPTEALLDLIANGRAPAVQEELARLSEDAAHAA